MMSKSKLKIHYSQKSEDVSSPALTAFVITSVTVIVIALFSLILWLSNGKNNRDDARNYNKALSTKAFFTTVQDGNTSRLENQPELLKFYLDLTEAESIVGSTDLIDNPLIPNGVDTIVIPTGAYNELCDYFIYLAAVDGNVASGYDCSSTGHMSAEFLDWYNDAKAGISKWVDTPNPVEPTYDDFKIWFTDGKNVIYGMLVLWFIASLAIIEPRSYKARWSDQPSEIWYPYFGKGLPIYFWLVSLVNPVLLYKTYRWSKPERERIKNTQMLIEKKTFSREIQKLKTDIEILENFVPRTTKIQSNIEKLEAILKDLEDFDTVMSVKTIEYLSQSKVDDAKEAKLRADAHLAAKDEIETVI